MNCPLCESEMRQYGRGATERKRGRRYLCEGQHSDGLNRIFTEDELRRWKVDAPQSIEVSQEDDIPF